MLEKRYQAIAFAFLLSFATFSTPVLGAADLAESVEILSQQLSRSVPTGRTLRVAVTDFPDLEGVVSRLGRFIGNRLTTRLASQSVKFEVVERQRLNQVLAELGFSMSGLVDPNKAKELGRMLGVEAIIVGTVSDLGNVVDVDARIIEIQPNRILSGVIVTIAKDNTVSNMIESERERVVPGPRIGPVPGQPSRVYLGTKKYQDFPNFRVEVEGLKVGPAGMVSVFLTYSNKTREDLLLGRYLDTSAFQDESKIFVVDSAGNRYDFKASSGMDDVHWNGRHPLAVGPGGRGTASFTFRSRGSREKLGKTFSFSSEQVIVKRYVSRHGDTKYRIVSKINISIRDIEPR